MKKSFHFCTVLLLQICFAQNEQNDFINLNVTSSKPATAKKQESKPGFMNYNGVEYPVVIVLNEGKSYTISDGFFNGNKKMYNESELELKLNQITKESNDYIISTIIVSNSKPFLVTLIKSENKKTKETIVIPLVEENNYLKMKGAPVKSITISGKTTIKVYGEIDTKTNEYVGHLILMK